MTSKQGQEATSKYADMKNADELCSGLDRRGYTLTHLVKNYMQKKRVSPVGKTSHVRLPLTDEDTANNLLIWS